MKIPLDSVRCSDVDLLCAQSVFLSGQHNPVVSHLDILAITFHDPTVSTVSLPKV